MIVVVGLWTFLRLAPWVDGHCEKPGLAPSTGDPSAFCPRPRLLRWDRILFSEAACQEKSSSVVSAPSLSSSCVRTTGARVSGSLCEVCHPSLHAVTGE